jgi:diaminohydroxyphosphoribosylaminopyrimidine deaminase/5-amino-6-(5-phosphoribosylamino)uracil reductase
MQRALELAARGAGETNPNPMVGSVLVREGRVVGEGWHARAGGPHAEVMALDAAGPRASGATLYVSLEPCAHHGRTPPCAPRVLASGVRRVVAALRDPNPEVGGRGLRLLRRAGVLVETGLLAAEAEHLNRRFLVAMRQHRPFVLLKAASTLDGRIAAASGDSRWITSDAARRAARGLRRLHDAVAVGIGTVLADDPRLMPEPAVRRAFHRVVFDSRLRIPVGSRLVRSARRSPVWVLCHDPPPLRARRLEAAGVRLLAGPARRGRVSLAWASSALYDEGITSVMVEGGSELLGSFLAERMLDEVALFRAPLLLGGRGSLPVFGGPDPRRIADALRMRRRRDDEAGAAGIEPVGLELWYPVHRRR